MSTRRRQHVFLCQTCRRCRVYITWAALACDRWCAYCQQVRGFQRVGAQPQYARSPARQEVP
jgi:hypothetical protein